MLLWSDVYASGDLDPQDVTFQRSAEAEAELLAARAAVEVVLEHNGILLESIKPKDFASYEWLAEDVEENVDWREPGNSVLSVPDVRHVFSAFAYMNN